LTREIFLNTYVYSKGCRYPFEIKVFFFSKGRFKLFKEKHGFLHRHWSSQRGGMCEKHVLLTSVVHCKYALLFSAIERVLTLENTMWQYLHQMQYFFEGLKESMDYRLWLKKWWHVVPAAPKITHPKYWATAVAKQETETTLDVWFCTIM
jgi:hypothetical protein